jgi:phosphoglycolate phosphatase
MDSIGTIVDCTMAAFAEIDEVPPPPRDRIRESIGMGLIETMQLHFPDWEDRIRERIVDNYRRLWRAEFKDCVKLFPGSLAAIRSLHEAGFLLGVATAKGRSGLERELDATGLRPYFHGTRTVDEAPSKPAPGMLLGLYNELGVRPEETLMIGDTSFDLEMARNARCASVGVLTGAQTAAHFTPHEPLAVLGSVAELPAWLAARSAAAALAGLNR